MRLMAPPRVRRDEITGVVAASKLGRAVSRCAAVLRRSEPGAVGRGGGRERGGGDGGGGGGGQLVSVAILCAVVKAKWKAALERK
jgi:hypothetical protein